MAKKTIPRACENCGARFLVEQYDINHGKGRFCSAVCANRFLGRERSGDAPAIAICRRCGKQFNVAPSQQRRNIRHCSKRCRHAPLGERFWAKVHRTETCWLWTAATTTDGYGLISKRGAHQVSWELHNGPIPDGLNVLHRCDNPPCVRPDHLFIGTQQDNIQDAIRKGRMGPTTGRAKLAVTQVQEVRRLYATGKATYKEIGDRFGVGISAINHIVHRRTWSNV